MTVHPQAAAEMDRLIKRFTNLGGVYLGDQVPDYVRGHGERTLVGFTIGHRGDLGQGELKEAVRVWRKVLKTYPKSHVLLHVAGYDKEPLELWEIPEASKYIAEWAKGCGLTTYINAALTPLHYASIGLLGKCGALRDIDPAKVLMAANINNRR